MYVATKTETEILKLLENGESLTKKQIIEKLSQTAKDFQIEKEVEGCVVKGFVSVWEDGGIKKSLNN